MIQLSITIKARPHKEQEFRQALEFLIPELSKNDGEATYRFSGDKHFLIEGSWPNYSVFEAHLQSDLFTVLMGAIKILCETPQIKLVENGRELDPETIYTIRRNHHL